MSIEKHQSIGYRPLIPRADNFTPRERTPWGGTKIARIYKRWLNLPNDLVIGESWEISGHPKFPTIFDNLGENGQQAIALPKLLDEFAEEILGKTISKKFNRQIPILIKLLDAADNLSVQVHPADGDKILKPGEMGKTEAWYILDAEPGSGIYLGFKPHVTLEELREALFQAVDISHYLNFVQVKPGDIYFIPAGTIHAIGKGVTLLEPQQTSETTYRFWDWNRKYNQNGEPDPSGNPRPLHADESFAVTNFDGQRGQAFVRQVKGIPRLQQQSEGNMEFLLLHKKHFVIEKVLLNTPEEFCLSKPTVFQAVTIVRGEVNLIYEFAGKIETLALPIGQSALIPAGIATYTFQRKSTEPAEIIKVRYPI
ncbi:class I mannose-6-phosphate isomerase [candidate division KSB1 bacterium]|nr:class I mannose-6-phosphate isomerase [candidate division KSB1 bacterium]